MPLRNRVKDFAKSKGISVYRLIKDTDISPTTGYALANNPEHLPHTVVLSHLCEVYQCQPSEFIVWSKK